MPTSVRIDGSFLDAIMANLSERGITMLDYGFPLIVGAIAARLITLTDDREAVADILAKASYLEGAWMLAHAKSTAAETAALAIMGFGGLVDVAGEKIATGGGWVSRRIWRGAKRLGGGAADLYDSWEGFRNWIDPLGDWLS